MKGELPIDPLTFMAFLPIHIVTLKHLQPGRFISCPRTGQGRGAWEKPCGFHVMRSCGASTPLTTHASQLVLSQALLLSDMSATVVREPWLSETRL